MGGIISGIFGGGDAEKKAKDAARTQAAADADRMTRLVKQKEEEALLEQSKRKRRVAAAAKRRNIFTSPLGITNKESEFL